MTVKYFTVGVMLTVFFLFTMTLFAINYLSFGIDNLSYVVLKDLAVTYTFYLNLTQKLFYVTIISLFLFKLGAFPFHFYLSDVYSALDLHRNMQTYTITLKAFILLAMFNIISQFWFVVDVFYPVLLVSALGSLFVGSFSALSQFSFRRFLAFSYLNAIGFVLLGLVTGLSFGFGAITFFTAKVYFLSYIIAWSLILLVMRTDGLLLGIDKVKQNATFYYITDLSLLSILSGNDKNSNKDFFANILQKLKFISLVIAFASLMGLPPTVGFFAKTVVYLGLVGSNGGILLLTFTLLLTPIMAFSYLKVLVQLLYPNKKKIGLNTAELISQDIFSIVGYGAKQRDLVGNMLRLSSMLTLGLILVVVAPCFYVNFIIY